MRIFLDVDGVLANFVGASGKLFGHTHDEVDEYAYYKSLLGLSSTQFWDGIRAHSPVQGSFWREIEPYPWCRDLHTLCNTYGPVTLLTAPPGTVREDKRNMLVGRTDWIHDHFGETYDEYFIGIKKERFASPDAVLIDDLDHNIDFWTKAGGKAILFPHRWNANRHLVGDQMGYVKAQLESIRTQAE